MIQQMNELLAKYDPAVAKAIEAEYVRERDGIELIASENFVSLPVLLAGSYFASNSFICCIMCDTSGL